MAQASENTRVSALKWIILGGLGFVALCFIALFMLAWKFSPILQIDTKKDQISLLGGLIKIEGGSSPGKSKHQVILRNTGKSRLDQGQVLLDSSLTTLKLPFENAKLDLKNSPNLFFKWHCQVPTETSALKVEPMYAGRATFSLKQTQGALCRFEIPNNITLDIQGENGLVRVIEPQFNIELHLENGQVEISPMKEKAYEFDLETKHGYNDFFESIAADDALKIRIRVDNGAILNKQ